MIRLQILTTDMRPVLLFGLKQFKYWAVIILVSYIPTIGFHYLMRPFWFNKTADHTSVTTFEMVFTILFLPIYLIIINYLLSKRNLIKWLFVFNAVIICSCVLISSRLHFLNWADSVGNRENPDNDTREVVAFEEQAGLLVTEIGIVITIALQTITNKGFKKSRQ